jgi:hypothetical protein
MGRQEQPVGLSAPSSGSHGFDSPTGAVPEWTRPVPGEVPAGSGGRSTQSTNGIREKVECGRSAIARDPSTVV